MKSITLVFQSSRDPGKHHRVSMKEGGPTVCTCPAGRRGGRCKHIRLIGLLVDHGTAEEITSRWEHRNMPGW